MGLQDISKRLASVENKTDYFERWVKRNQSLLSDVTAIEQRIANLEGSDISTFKTTLKRYANYFTGNDGFGFLFFTDPHDMSDNYSNTDLLTHLHFVRTVFEHTPAKFVLCGGDFINSNHTLADAKYYIGKVPNLYREEIAQETYIVAGNHDLNVEGYVDTYLTEKQLAKIWFDRDVGYYRIEYPSCDCYAFDTGPYTTEMNEYRWEQVDWFATCLLSSTKPHLFGVGHIFGIGNKDPQQYTAPLLGDNLTKIANAYNQKTSITLNDKTYDFSSAVGTFHFIMSGHWHADLNDTINNIPIIYTTYGRRVDCCYADFNTNVLHLVRTGLESSTIGDRDINIIPFGESEAPIDGGLDDNGYVENGLVMFLDGLNKGPVGNVWESVVGNYDFNLYNCELANNGVVFNGSTSYGQCMTAIPNRPSDSTIEICIDLQPNNGYSNEFILSPPEDAKSGNFLGASIGNNANYPICTGFGNRSNTRWYARTTKMTASLNDVRGFVNGSSADIWNNVGSFSGNTTDNGTTIGLRYYGTNKQNIFKGTIYAIRIYNRILTADEMKHNQRIDNERYGLGLVM